VKRPQSEPIAGGQQTCLHEFVIRRVLAIVGSAAFLVLAPGFVAGMVPWWISHWRFETALLGLPVLRVAGGALVALGVTGLLDSFGRFAIQGIGTPLRFFRRGIWLSPDFIVMSEIRCTWQLSALSLVRA